jgi:hypothetical protein
VQADTISTKEDEIKGKCRASHNDAHASMIRFPVYTRTVFKILIQKCKLNEGTSGECTVAKNFMIF